MNNEQTTNPENPLKKDLSDKLRHLIVNYDEGHDDPHADIRHKECSMLEAKKVFTSEQLDYVLSQLEPQDDPIRFYVRYISFGLCPSLEISLLLKRNEKKIFRELYFSSPGIEPKKAKLYWKWYENWLDPWR